MATIALRFGRPRDLFIFRSKSRIAFGLPPLGATLAAAATAAADVDAAPCPPLRFPWPASSAGCESVSAHDSLSSFSIFSIVSSGSACGPGLSTLPLPSSWDDWE
uniref:Uncharacterized protein n=1 Tax=Anopheles coluzzii TaxID=1518534 RepID=A0A8W7PZ19_ANOCL